VPTRTFLANIADCPPGSSIEVTAEQRVVALFNLDGDFFALDGICPHQGGPLGKGSLSGCIVTCPWHQWKFDVQTGQCQLTAAIKQPTIELQIKDERIYADL
jgi:nitrite reductase/ring-hydroxylating ferredoxin subunit